MARRNRLLSRALLLFCFGVAATASSCDSYDKYCEDQVDCLDGNDLDIEACIEAQESESDRASLYGCGEWFDVLMECLEKEADCDNDVWTAGDNCDDEQKDYADCMAD